MRRDEPALLTRSETASPTKIWGPLVLATALLTTLSFRYWAFTVDDAFISLRYAKHLVAGQGLVFNIGERVEGFTSFTWMLLGAAALGLGLDPIIGLKIIGLLCALVTTWICLLILRHFEPHSSGFMWLLAFLVAGAPCTVVWAVGGLETMLFAALLSATVYLYLIGRTMRGWPLWPVLNALAALTRPEGLLAFPILGIHLWVTGADKRGRALAKAVVPFLILFGSFLLWRITYYGDVVPNTYYAKVASQDFRLALGGARYLLEFMRSYCGPVTLVLLGSAALLRRKDQPVTVLVVLVVAYFLTPLGLGSDWMPQFRYLAPYWPLGAVVVTLGAARITDVLVSESGERRHRWIRPIIAGLVMAGFALSFGYQVVLAYNPGGPRYGHYGITVRHHARATTYLYIPAGKKLATMAKPGETLAAFAVGALAYYSDMHTYDVHGLTSKAIARRTRSQRLTYVLSLQPTYIEDLSGEAFSSGMRELPEFRQYYEPLSDSFPESLIFVRKDARQLSR